MTDVLPAVRHVFASFEQYDNGEEASIIAKDVEAVYVDDESRTCIRMRTGHCYRVREGRTTVVGRIEAVLDASVR